MRRRRIASMPGRIAAATMKARKRSAISTRTFHSASASTTTAPTTTATTNALRAVSVSTRDCWPRREGAKPMSETIRVESRLHGVVLAWPLARAGLLGIAGAVLVFAGWPFSVAGAVALALAAFAALRAVWRWERTRIFLTDERLLVVEGTLRRREAAVALAR